MTRHDPLIVGSTEPAAPTRPRISGKAFTALALGLAAAHPFAGFGPVRRQRGAATHLLERTPDAVLDAKAKDKRERRRQRNLRISGASPDNEQCPRLSPDHW